MVRQRTDILLHARLPQNSRGNQPSHSPRHQPGHLLHRLLRLHHRRHLRGEDRAAQALLPHPAHHFLLVDPDHDHGGHLQQNRPERRRRRRHPLRQFIRCHLLLRHHAAAGPLPRRGPQLRAARQGHGVFVARRQRRAHGEPVRAARRDPEYRLEAVYRVYSVVSG